MMQPSLLQELNKTLHRESSKNLHRELYDLIISEEIKIELSKLLAEFEYRLSQGSTEQIQLQALLAKIVLLQDFK